MTQLSEDLVERGVDVLSRLSRMKVSLTDVSFIAGWVGDARIAIREAASQLEDMTAERDEWKRKSEGATK